MLTPPAATVAGQPAPGPDDYGSCGQGGPSVVVQQAFVNQGTIVLDESVVKQTHNNTAVAVEHFAERAHRDTIGNLESEAKIQVRNLENQMQEHLVLVQRQAEAQVQASQ